MDIEGTASTELLQKGGKKMRRYWKEWLKVIKTFGIWRITIKFEKLSH